MKLATLDDGSRDGRLLIVSGDLSHSAKAGAAPTLQAALDDWENIATALAAQYVRLNADDQKDTSPFDPTACASPLPRSFQWADGSAYVNHVELVRKARGAEMPESFWTEPLMYQGGSDCFLGPRDDILVADEAWGVDFEGEVAVIVDDTPMGVTPAEASKKIRLIMLANDISLRALIPAELDKGFGFFQAKPASAFSPVAVTPDELGEAWDGRQVHLPLLVTYNEELFGRANAGVDMTFDFAQLIAHAAKTRPLSAGTIIGSGTVSNKDASGGPGKPIKKGGVGYSCLAEIRMVETIETGRPETHFMKFGDRVRIEMRNGDGASIFGAIEQTVRPYTRKP